jgi:hypothetical protein
MTGEMQDDNLLARRWTLVLAMTVRFADAPRETAGVGFT